MNAAEHKEPKPRRRHLKPPVGSTFQTFVSMCRGEIILAWNNACTHFLPMMARKKGVILCSFETGPRASYEPDRLGENIRLVGAANRRHMAAACRTKPASRRQETPRPEQATPLDIPPNPQTSTMASLMSLDHL